MYVHSGFEIPLFRVQRRRRGRQHTLELLYAAINSILSYMLKKKKLGLLGMKTHVTHQCAAH